MRLTAAQLVAQFNRAQLDWPWIREVEDQYKLPPYLLYALGSRETNLRNITGDGGHGRGIWQRDDRSFPIPDPYPVRQQAIDAGSLLASHFWFFHTRYPAISAWNAAVCAYNAGRTGVRRMLDSGRLPQEATTWGDYGPDVLERWAYLVYWSRAGI